MHGSGTNCLSLYSTCPIESELNWSLLVLSDPITPICPELKPRWEVVLWSCDPLQFHNKSHIFSRSSVIIRCFVCDQHLMILVFSVRHDKCVRSNHTGDKYRSLGTDVTSRTGPLSFVDNYLFSFKIYSSLSCVCAFFLYFPVQCWWGNISLKY